MATSLILRKHQQQTVAFGLENKCIADFSDAGTGKTLSAISLALNINRSGKILVICPKSTLYVVWDSTIKTFFPTVEVSICVCPKRRLGFKQKADIYITNHDAVSELIKYPIKLWNDFSTLIVDESTAFKSYASYRSKAIIKLAPHFMYRMILSGTPMTNSILDIFQQMQILKTDNVLGSSFFKFRSTVCEAIQCGPDSQHKKWVAKEGMLNSVTKIISPYVIRHKLQACTDVPTNQKICVEYIINKKTRTLYNKFKKEAVLFFNPGDKPLTAVNAGILYTKLQQILSGAVYIAKEVYEVLDKERYHHTIDLANEYNCPVVIPYLWTHQFIQLSTILDEQKINYLFINGSVTLNERTKRINDFQTGDYKILLLHPRAAGHGITLTAGLVTEWASPTYDGGLFSQTNSRIHRIGQEEKTVTITIIAKDTVEDKIYKSLNTKLDLQYTFLELLAL